MCNKKSSKDAKTPATKKPTAIVGFLGWVRLACLTCQNLHICYYSPMSTIDIIRDALSGLTWTQLCKVADEIRIPPHTVRRIVSGATKNPSFESVEALRKYVEGHRTNISN